MNRIVAGVARLTAAAVVLVGCSDDKGGPARATAAGDSQVSTGGSTEVKVDALAASADMGRTVPVRSPREPIRSTGARFPPASSTRPSAPVGWRIEVADGFAKAVVHVELSGPGLASGIAVWLR